jgi:ABC-type transport system substrate-binding protein
MKMMKTTAVFVAVIMMLPLIATTSAASPSTELTTEPSAIATTEPTDISPPATTPELCDDCSEVIGDLLPPNTSNNNTGLGTIDNPVYAVLGVPDDTPMGGFLVAGTEFYSLGTEFIIIMTVITFFRVLLWIIKTVWKVLRLFLPI